MLCATFYTQAESQAGRESSGHMFDHHCACADYVSLKTMVGGANTQAEACSADGVRHFVDFMSDSTSTCPRIQVSENTCFTLRAKRLGFEVHTNTQKSCRCLDAYTHARRAPCVVERTAYIIHVYMAARADFSSVCYTVNT